jgi:hypothetical protein
LLHQPVEEHAAGLREPTVETEKEFVEIRLYVSGRDGTLVSAAQPSFQQGDDQVDRVEFLARSLAAGGNDVRLGSSTIAGLVFDMERIIPRLDHVVGICDTLASEHAEDA